MESWHLRVEVISWFALNIICFGSQLCDFGVSVCGCFLGLSTDVAGAIVSLSGFPVVTHKLKRVMRR